MNPGNKVPEEAIQTAVVTSESTWGTSMKEKTVDPTVKVLDLRGVM